MGMTATPTPGTGGDGLHLPLHPRPSGAVNDLPAEGDPEQEFVPQPDNSFAVFEPDPPAAGLVATVVSISSDDMSSVEALALRPEPSGGDTWDSYPVYVGPFDITKASTHTLELTGDGALATFDDLQFPLAFFPGDALRASFWGVNHPSIGGPLMLALSLVTARAGGA